jgi:hypothetical protein
MATSADCRLVEQDGRAWCAVCLQPYKYGELTRRATAGDVSRVKRACAGLPPPAAQQPEPPPLAKRMGNAARAVARRARSQGAPCTDAQIAERSAICLACELFRRDGPDTADGICTHSDCGCPVSPRRRFRNKAAWSSESCPLGKWPEVADKPADIA